MDPNRLSDDEKRIIKRLLEKEEEIKKKKRVKGTSLDLLEKSHRRQDFYQFQILSSQAKANRYLLLTLVIFIFFPFLQYFLISLEIKLSNKLILSLSLLMILFGIFFIGKSIQINVHVKKMEDFLKKVIYKVE